MIPLFPPRRAGRGLLAGLRTSACLLLLSPVLCAQSVDPASPDTAFPVSVSVDAAKTRGPLREVWRFFGCDEPNYTTMKDGRKLLGELGALKPGSIYFRTHNLLNTGDGTPALKWGSTNAYTEDAQGNPIYDWSIVDRILDSGLSRGVRPYLQLGFMPQALSSQPEPYQHAWRPGFPYDLITGGWAYPPKDYKKWGALAYEWTRHCVERYGRSEVEKWYFEIWNEPNGPAYWHGTPEEFQKLHDYAVDGIRRALPSARVGGPDVAGSGGKFMDDFLAHVTTGTNFATGQKGTPTDFTSFHAKGSPRFVDGHVRMGIAAHLSGVDRGFAKIAAIPELKNKPIIIGESDPEGCAACQGPQNAYRNGTMYSSYTAASFARKHDLADKHGVNFEGALTWAFEFEDQPYFAGFRVLGSNGIDLPVLNVFRMFSLMHGMRLEASSSAERPLDALLTQGAHEQPDVGVFASSDGSRLCIMIWHYHDDDVKGPDADITLSLTGLPPRLAQARLSHYRIDENHGNAYAAWLNAGAPIAPDVSLYAQLEAAGKLALLEPPHPLNAPAGREQLHFTLPRQGVSLIVLESLDSTKSP